MSVRKTLYNIKKLKNAQNSLPSLPIAFYHPAIENEVEFFHAYQTSSFQLLVFKVLPALSQLECPNCSMNLTSQSTHEWPNVSMNVVGNLILPGWTAESLRGYGGKLKRRTK